MASDDMPEAEALAFLASQRRFELTSRRVFGLLMILATTAPLWMLVLMIRALAGKSTVLNVSVSVAATIAVSVCILTKRKKMQSQHDELVRLRERVSVYERQLGL